MTGVEPVRLHEHCPCCDDRERHLLGMLLEGYTAELEQVRESGEWSLGHVAVLEGLVAQLREKVESLKEDHGAT